MPRRAKRHRLGRHSVDAGRPRSVNATFFHFSGRLWGQAQCERRRSPADDVGPFDGLDGRPSAAPSPVLRV
jgi:hypothetical protein